MGLANYFHHLFWEIRFIGVQPRSSVHVLGEAALLLQRQSWVVATEAICPQSLKYLLSGLHRKNLPTHALEESCQLWKWPSSLEFSSTAQFNRSSLNCIVYKVPVGSKGSGQRGDLYGALPATIPTSIQMIFSQNFIMNNFKIQKSFKKVWWTPKQH